MRNDIGLGDSAERSRLVRWPVWFLNHLLKTLPDRPVLHYCCLL